MPMTSKDSVLARERERGRAAARSLATRAPELSGTAIIAEEDHIPAWSKEAVYTADMVGWPVRDNGQIYTILQPHTPAYNPGVHPADLPAIYSLKHTKDPARAKPFQMPNGASGAYMTGDCCTQNGGVYRSLLEPNVWSPAGYPTGWEYVGAVEEVQS